ncbi:MAG: amidophosphoribosyltransferase [Streptococcaceae bacterium]|jgi:amidophosphoribosyltransferase|nr:amidophosphoribosyltransferase [Streptococcaceae bacterium]
MNDKSWFDKIENTDEASHLNEECGLFGVWNHPDAARLTYFGLHALQHRGQEGAGILTNDKGQLKRFRGLGLVTDVFKKPENLESLTGTAAIGHVRYATAGNARIDNIQPFLFEFLGKSFGLAHNGNLTNADSLRTELEKNGAIFSSTSDTEVLMHLIRRSHHPEMMGRIKEALNTVKGGFAYLMMVEDSLIAALDPNGFRPLSIGKMANGAIVVASETCAFDVVGATWLQDVNPGEVVIINDKGIQVDTYTNNTQLNICSMEYIYFARPDSIIHGVNVHNARKQSGRILAREAQIDADMVIGVPNSSLSAASGYAEESGLPYEMGLIKNQYVARTFIQPTQELREQGVRMKLSAVRGVVEGKRVIMVDDSIVRGTTSRRIVRLLKEAGAAEVHVVIASPPLAYPCFYGIDIQKREELIAATHTVEEIRDLIEADSLTYLSVDGLVEAIGHKDLTLSYFTGDYPTPLYDYEDAYTASLTAEPKPDTPNQAAEEKYLLKESQNV